MLSIFALIKAQLAPLRRLSQYNFDFGQLPFDFSKAEFCSFNMQSLIAA